jgi:arylsulfatase A-like enzyme
MAGKPVKGPVEPSIRALYAAAVKYQDEKLGELLAVLRRRLDLDHAVVAITADHGENLGEGGRFDHVFALDDALLHVPLAIRDPAAFPAGRIDGLCQLVDVPETLLALTGRDGDAAKLCDRSAGRSLLPGKFQPREVVVGFGDPYLGHLAPMERFAGFNRDVARYVGVLRSIRDGSRKLVRSTTRDDELYDLRADRDEIHDVAASDPAAPAVIDALGKRLDEELKALPGYDGPPRRPPKDPDLGPANDPRLQQLGYSQPPPR